MQRTIQIGDKYKPLMKWYNEQYDKEEFNVFISQLLISYKKMKEKNIDLIMLSELIGKYDVDIYDILKLLEQNDISKSFNSSQVANISTKTVNNIVNNNEIEKNKKEQTKIKNAILDIGVDLSG